MSAVAPAAAADVPLAWKALYAEDCFATALNSPGADLLQPVPDPRLSPDWAIAGTLTATDALFGPGSLRVAQQRVFYGWLLEHAGEFVLAIRGTGDALEWGIDGMFMPRTAHPVAGLVESGFWSVYQSMQIDGKPLSEILKLAPGPITVVGHSLGAAIATYVAFYLALAGAKVRGVFVASPHPGDETFCKAFGKAVPDHVMYRNVDDVVPRVPFWFGYSDVPNVCSLSAGQEGLRVDGGLPAQHHVLTYTTLMDKTSLAAFHALPIDEKFLACIHVGG